MSGIDGCILLGAASCARPGRSSWRGCWTVSALSAAGFAVICNFTGCCPASSASNLRMLAGRTGCRQDGTGARRPACFPASRRLGSELLRRGLLCFPGIYGCFLLGELGSGHGVAHQHQGSTSALFGLPSLFPVGHAMHIELACGALCACVLLASSQSLTHVQGVVQHMCTEPSGGCWVLTGSSRGQMALWDMRFQLQVGHGLAR